MSYIFVSGSRIKDLTNMEFGYLTAKKCIGIENRYAVWMCECSCGCESTCTATSKQLLDKKKRDCGSGKSKKAKRRNLTGETFDSLEVVKLLEDGKMQKYLCKCLLCGDMCEVTESNLVSRATKSCGCLRQKDIKNMQFGELTAKRKTEKRRNGSIVWEFQCSCGNLCYYTVAQIDHGFRSCGCYNEILKEKHVHLYMLREPDKLRVDNKSGYTGVMLTKDGKWLASITFQKKYYYLGRHTDKDEAIRIRNIAENKLHGDFLDWYENEFKKEREKRK